MSRFLTCICFSKLTWFTVLLQKFCHTQVVFGIHAMRGWSKIVEELKNWHRITPNMPMQTKMTYLPEHYQMDVFVVEALIILFISGIRKGVWFHHAAPCLLLIFGVHVITPKSLMTRGSKGRGRPRAESTQNVYSFVSFIIAWMWFLADTP